MRWLWGMMVPALFGAAPAATADGVDITKIYENYLASAVAAKRCGGTDPGQNTGFLKNLMIVTISATQKVQQRTGLPDEQVRAMFERNSKLIEQGTGRYIDDKGCADPQVAVLLKMYQVHSNPGLSDSPSAP